MDCIYKITNPNGLSYIGRTGYFRSRMNSYKNCKCKSQPRLCRSIEKYGWNNHKVEIILRTDNPINAEIKLIEFYNTFNKGLNLTIGGEGVKHTIETRRKLSESKKGKPGGKKGYKLNDTQRETVRNACKGNKNRRLPVFQYSKKEEFIQRFDSMSEAADSVNIYVSSISNCLKGNAKTAGGYIWKKLKHENTY